jgi:hypothetical protein
MLGCFDERVNTVRVDKMIVRVLNYKNGNPQFRKLRHDELTELHKAHNARNRVSFKTAPRKRKAALATSVFGARTETIDDRLGELR